MTNYDFTSRTGNIFKGWKIGPEDSSTIYLSAMIFKEYKDFHFTEVFFTEHISN